MKGKQLSHQWQPCQISQLTLTRSKFRSIIFRNSILPHNKLQIIYTFIYHLFRYHRLSNCLHLAKQLFSSIDNFLSNKIPTHHTSALTKPKQMSAFTPSPHALFVWHQIISKLFSFWFVWHQNINFPNQIKPCAMKIVTGFETMCDEL